MFCHQCVVPSARLEGGEPWAGAMRDEEVGAHRHGCGQPANARHYIEIIRGPRQRGLMGSSHQGRGAGGPLG
eukprot:1160827-Pelagomonas_calceolata.AAC.17